MEKKERTFSAKMMSFENEFVQGFSWSRYPALTFRIFVGLINLIAVNSGYFLQINLSVNWQFMSPQRMVSLRVAAQTAVVPGCPGCQAL